MFQIRRTFNGVECWFCYFHYFLLATIAVGLRQARSSLQKSCLHRHAHGFRGGVHRRRYALGIAYEFDPYFGLSISRVDPLPHQLEAIYDYLLKLARVRFLLADDAGAGKTIMSGLLIRELELRGLAERILIVCPANLAFQWQRELKEKFDTTFLVMKGQDIRDQFGVNQWLERNRVITSLDLAKRSEILSGLRQVHWDLVIVDEAHRMSAADESHKSLRYRLGELLRDSSDHILLLTAPVAERMPSLARELVALNPDVILTGATSGVLAARTHRGARAA